MNYLTILKQPRIATLWVSQVLSAFGDQLYILAVMWMCVQYFGPKAAFVAAAISVGRISLGLLGGVLADRFNRGAIMVASDIIRFLAVITLPVAAIYGAINFWHFMFVGLMIGAFGALFDPALQASLPLVVSDNRSLQAINGLIDVTQRLGRAVSPSLAGFLVMLLPLEHFFTLDAISFIVSAAAIAALSSHIKWNQNQTHNKGKFQPAHIVSDFVEGFKAVQGHKGIVFGLATSFVMSGLWGCAFTVGMPLLVKDTFTAGIADYGLIVGAYGLGNVIGNIFIANMNIQRKILMMCAADMVLGIGFLLIANCHSLPIALFGSTLAALGGPMGELTLLNLITDKIHNSHLGKSLSFRLLATNSGYSIGLMIAAPIYAHFSPPLVISVSALLMILAGAIGLPLVVLDKMSIPRYEPTTVPEFVPVPTKIPVYSKDMDN